MGEGNRKTLKTLQEIIPLKILEYPTGQHVYDWKIPKEWNIKDAWIKNSEGIKIVDFRRNNLHVVSYSRPVNDIFSFEQLHPKLHYREDLPEAIPYRTLYYTDDWGFCLSYEDFKRYFKSGEKYQVYIKAHFEDGSLSVGELLIPGRYSKEYLISTYICHPSMANDNISGMIMTAFLSKALMDKKTNFSYRIIFVPETIGAIAYCANHEKEMKNIDCGLVISCVGGPGKFGYKQSFNPNHFINQAIEDVFYETNTDYLLYPFDIQGSDERQYSSPGFRINTATICKDRYYDYKYYHTSLDDLNFVKSAYIYESLILYLKLIDKMDKNLIFQSKNIYGEPMLSKYTLYSALGGDLHSDHHMNEKLKAILWLIFYCDGRRSLHDIKRKTGLSLTLLYEMAQMLCTKGLLEERIPQSKVLYESTE